MLINNHKIWMQQERYELKSVVLTSADLSITKSVCDLTYFFCVFFNSACMMCRMQMFFVFDNTVLILPPKYLLIVNWVTKKVFCSWHLSEQVCIYK